MKQGTDVILSYLSPTGSRCRKR